MRREKWIDMNVLILSIPSSIPSGAAVVPKQLQEGFAKRRGVNVAMITHWWTCGFEGGTRYNVFLKGKGESFFMRKTKSDEKLCTVSRSRFKVNVSREKVREVNAELGDAVLDFILKKGFSPDIIHIHTHTFEYDGFMDTVRRRLNVPLVYTVHQLWKSAKESPRGQGYLRLLDRAAEIITISQGWADTMQEIFKQHIKRKRITVIHNCTDLIPLDQDSQITQRASELRSQYAPKGEKILLFSGRAEEIKLQGLPWAFSKLARKRANVVLVMLGASKKDIGMLTKLGLEKKYMDRVVFTGWINGASEKGKREIAAHYKMLAPQTSDSGNELSGIVVMPVRTENNYGLSVLDAMAMKAPVITCKGRLSPEPLGCLPDREPLYKSITYALDRKNQKKVRDNANEVFSVIEKEFSTAGYFIGEHLKVYRRVLAEHSERNDSSELEKLMNEVDRERGGNIEALIEEREQEIEEEIERRLKNE